MGEIDTKQQDKKQQNKKADNNVNHAVGNDLIKDKSTLDKVVEAAQASYEYARKNVKDRDLAVLKEVLFGDPEQLRQRLFEFQVLCDKGKMLLHQLTYYYYQAKDGFKNVAQQFTRMFARFRAYAPTVRNFLTGPVANTILRVGYSTMNFFGNVAALGIYGVSSLISYTWQGIKHSAKYLATLASFTIAQWKLSGSLYMHAVREALKNSKLVNAIKNGYPVVVELAKKGAGAIRGSVVNASLFIAQTAKGITIKVVNGLLLPVAEIAFAKLAALMLVAAAVGTCIGLGIDYLARKGSTIAQAIQKPISGLFVHIFLSPGEGRRWKYNTKTATWESVKDTRVFLNKYLTKEENEFLKLRLLANRFKKDPLQEIFYRHTNAQQNTIIIQQRNPQDYLDNFKTTSELSKLIFSEQKTEIKWNIDEIIRREQNFYELSRGRQYQKHKKSHAEVLYAKPVLKAVDKLSGAEYIIDPYIQIKRKDNQTYIDTNREDKIERELYRSRKEEEKQYLKDLKEYKESIAKKSQENQLYLVNVVQKNQNKALEDQALYYRYSSCWVIRKFLYYYERIIGSRSLSRMLLMKASKPDYWKSTSNHELVKKAKLIRKVLDKLIVVADKTRKRKKYKNDKYKLTDKKRLNRLKNYRNILFNVSRLSKNNKKFDSATYIQKMEKNKKGIMQYYLFLFKKLNNPYKKSATETKLSNLMSKRLSKSIATEIRAIIKNQKNALIKTRSEYSSSLKIMANKKKSLEELNAFYEIYEKQTIGLSIKPYFSNDERHIRYLHYYTLMLDTPQQRYSYNY